MVAWLRPALPSSSTACACICGSGGNTDKVRTSASGCFLLIISRSYFLSTAICCAAIAVDSLPLVPAFYLARPSTQAPSACQTRRPASQQPPPGRASPPASPGDQAGYGPSVLSAHTRSLIRSLCFLSPSFSYYSPLVSLAAHCLCFFAPSLHDLFNLLPVNPSTRLPGNTPRCPYHHHNYHTSLRCITLLYLACWGRAGVLVPVHLAIHALPKYPELSTCLHRPVSQAFLALPGVCYHHHHHYHYHYHYPQPKPKTIVPGAAHINPLCLSIPPLNWQGAAQRQH